MQDMLNEILKTIPGKDSAILKDKDINTCHLLENKDLDTCHLFPRVLILNQF